MRLIDADNMRKATKGMFIYQDEFEDDTQHIAFEAYTKEDIENERTVEAIPIEWIKKKIKEKKERFVGYCDELTPVFVMYEQVLSDWEKENDKRQ